MHGMDQTVKTAGSALRARSPMGILASNSMLFLPSILYLVAFAIYPLFYSARLSMTRLESAAGAPIWVGFRNYQDLMVDPQFWNAAMNSLLFVSATVFLQVLLGVGLALFFNLQLRGSWLVRSILILPMLITPIVVGVMWRALLNPDWGLVNWMIESIGFTPPNWLGSVRMGIVTLIMVEVWQWTPFVFVVVFARLQALPTDFYDAAEIDGASRLNIFRFLTLPLLMPAIAFATVFRAVDSFRSFDLVYGLTYGGPARATTTLSFFAFQHGFQFQNYGYAAAASYVMLLILVVGTTLMFRYANLRPEHLR